MSSYTVPTAGVEIVAEIERKRSRFLTVMRRADSTEDAQALVDRLRKEHHSARHHCSAWAIGHDRRIQRANDDGEPSGTAGSPMLEALTKFQTPVGGQDLSDVVVVVVRWFGGTLLGAGGLVSAYSDSVIAVLEQAQAERAFQTRWRMRQFGLPAPIAEAGKWENALRAAAVTVVATDYATCPGSAVLQLAVQDDPSYIEKLQAQASAVSSGTADLTDYGVEWTEISSGI